MIDRTDVWKTATSSSVNQLKAKRCPSYSRYGHILLCMHTGRSLGQFYLLSVTEGLNDRVCTTVRSIMMGQLGRKYVAVCVLKHYRNSDEVFAFMCHIVTRVFYNLSLTL
jgi:hypothetical protein